VFYATLCVHRHAASGHAGKRVAHDGVDVCSTHDTGLIIADISTSEVELEDLFIALTSDKAA
jgi:hypothetical protein